ncbi:3-oxoadipate enol-lactonase [Sneathiella glossodoripedis]|uniref:3-oxoadipate enol-lactonase n=1 Tax=Sneathiella glossodoripedis TaxID=418853 RepID=UPI0018FF2AB5|nr:3-oxoadipate enol-lactonase [Sneathiella glossodoripedis]
MQFATVNTVNIHFQYLEAAKDKPVLVFVNSLGTDFRIWDAITSELSEAFSILRYDKRGHGLSDLGKTPYKMDDHIDDLEALIEHLNIQNVIVCGLSVGGMIAQGIALKRPDIVRALVLCDTGHKIGTSQMWQERIDALETGGLSSMVDAVMERWFTAEFRHQDNPEFLGCRAMLERQSLAGYVSTCAAIRDADFTDQVPSIAMPTLCLVGDQDLATTPDLVRELCSLIPGAEFSEISNAAYTMRGATSSVL